MVEDDNSFSSWVEAFKTLSRLFIHTNKELTVHFIFFCFAVIVLSLIYHVNVFLSRVINLIIPQRQEKKNNMGKETKFYNKETEEALLHNN